MTEIEISKDEWEIKKNARIIYYDLLRGLENVKKIYTYHLCDRCFYRCDEEADKHIEKSYLSRNWIEAISILFKKLDDKEIKYIYSLYDSFGMINDNVSRIHSSNLDRLILENNDAISFIPNEKNSSYYEYIKKLYEAIDTTFEKIFSNEIVKDIISNGKKANMISKEINELNSKYSNNIGERIEAFKDENSEESKIDKLIKQKLKQTDDINCYIKMERNRILEDESIVCKNIKSQYALLIKKIQELAD